MSDHHDEDDKKKKKKSKPAIANNYGVWTKNQKIVESYEESLAQLRIKKPWLFNEFWLIVKIKVQGGTMSNHYNEDKWESIVQQVELEDSKLQLCDEIQAISLETGLHQDDDRDEILHIIAESRYHTE